MDMKKKDLLLCVSSAMFVLFSVLGLTGLINWLILPRGRGNDEGFLISLRHFFRDIHEWAGLFFIVVVLVHLWLHKDYIINNWNKYIAKKTDSPM